MFKNILFATSTTKACDPAARVAFNISNLYKAQINIFHVIESVSPDDAQVESDVTAKEKIENYYADYLSRAKKYEIKTQPIWTHT